MRSEAAPELIARARGDRAAFAELYDLYVARIYAFCALHSASREDAEDLTAQTFERALRAMGLLLRQRDRVEPPDPTFVRALRDHLLARTAAPMQIPMRELTGEGQPPRGLDAGPETDRLSGAR